MELTDELLPPEIGEVDDHRRQRACWYTEQLPSSQRRHIDAEPASVPRVRHHCRSRVQPAHKPEEGATLLSRVWHRDDVGGLAQAESKGEGARRQTAMDSGRETGERVALVSPNDMNGLAGREGEDLAAALVHRAARHGVTLGHPAPRESPSGEGRRRAGAR